MIWGERSKYVLIPLLCMVLPHPNLYSLRREAAFLIMRDYYNFPDVLLKFLDSYATSHGDRGELPVAAFFTCARDSLVRQIPKAELFPHAPICPTFSVKDLLSKLFQAAQFSMMLDSLPSIHRADFSQQKFGEVFGRTRTHFNHLIKPYYCNSKFLCVHILRQ